MKEERQTCATLPHQKNPEKCSGLANGKERVEET